MSPAVGDRLVVEGRVIRPGRRIMVVAADIWAETGATRKTCRHAARHDDPGLRSYSPPPCPDRGAAPDPGIFEHERTNADAPHASFMPKYPGER